MNAGNRSINCLNITITPTFHKSILENCRIELLRDNSSILCLEKPNRGNRYKFSLKSNSHYTVVISCEGFYKRKISFDTSIPDSVSLAMIFQFCAKVEMIPIAIDLNTDLDDYPVAIIGYDPSKDLFNPKQKYTVLVKKGLFTKPEVPAKEAVVMH